MDFDVLKRLHSHYSNEWHELDEHIEELSMKRKYTAEVLDWIEREMKEMGK